MENRVVVFSGAFYGSFFVEKYDPECLFQDKNRNPVLFLV